MESTIGLVYKTELILRLLITMQTSDKNGVATAEGWPGGEKVIVSPPQTTQDEENRLNEGHEYIDWYFSRAEL